jgi:hypothetical protein
MGPSAPLDPRAPKAPDPLRGLHLLKRNTGREVREWANDPGGPELMRRRVLRSMGTGRPSRVFPGGGTPLPSMGDRCRSGESGHARAVWGAHSPRRPVHLPDEGPAMQSEMSGREEGRR